MGAENMYPIGRGRVMQRPLDQGGQSSRGESFGSGCEKLPWVYYTSLQYY